MKRGSDVDKIVLIYTTWPNAETAERAAEAAVDARLAACVNILGPSRSIYRWRGQVERVDETVALFKTTALRAAALSKLIIEQHPYETPAAICLNAENTGSNAEYLRWVIGETGGTS